MAVDFKELKREDCRTVARRLGLELNRQDKARCFLHAGDKNPSLQVYADGWKCFGCGEHGDAVDLISKYLSISNVEAVEWMKKEFNIQEPPRKQDYGQAERTDEKGYVSPGRWFKICVLAPHGGRHMAEGPGNRPSFPLHSRRTGRSRVYL